MSDSVTMMEEFPMTGKPPASRLSSAQAAYRFISKFEANDVPRSQARAKIRGMLDGNPPYNASELKRLGQGYRTNLNFREAKAAVKAMKSSYYNLIMEPETKTTFTLRQSAKAQAAAKKTSRDPEQPSPEEYPAIMAAEFNQTLEDWDNFLFETMRTQDEMVTFGVGVGVFPDDQDWKFKALPMASVLVPPDAPATLDGQELLVLKVEHRVTELYDKIADPEQAAASREAGWDTTLLREVLHKAYERNGTRETWEDVQRRIKNDDLSETFAGPRPVKLYQLLWREFDGQVSIALCVPDEAETRFLYKKVAAYPDFSQVLSMFFSEIGDGSYHSVRGLGYEVFPHCEVSNRNLCTLIDGTTIASGIVLRQKAGSPPGVPRMMRVGPFSVLPAGYDVADQGFNPNLEGVLKVRDLMQANLASNIGQFKPNYAETPSPTQRRTAREVSLASRKEASLEQTDVNHYYLQWDRLYREMFRRLINPDLDSDSTGWDDRKSFIQRCVDRGIPRELIKFEYWKIKATRSSGAGSPVIQDINSSAMLELAPYLDRKGRYQAIRNRVLTIAGPDNLDRYIGDMDRDQEPVIDSSIARIESNMLGMGLPATAGSGEDHVAHMIVHELAFREVVDMMQKSGGQTDYAQAVQVVVVVIQHLAEHLGFLEGNPAYAEEFGYYSDLLKELKALMGKWTAAAKSQQEAAAREQEKEQQASDKVTIEVEKEKIRTNALLQERLAKEQSLAENRDAKTIHGMKLKEAAAAQKMRLAEEKGRQG